MNVYTTKFNRKVSNILYRKFCAECKEILFSYETIGADERSRNSFREECVRIYNVYYTYFYKIKICSAGGVVSLIFEFQLVIYVHVMVSFG